MTIMKNMSAAQFIKLYFVQKNTIIKEAGSLPFCGAQGHRFCSSLTTKASVSVFVRGTLSGRLYCPEGPTCSGTRSNWHRSLRKTLAQVDALLID